jgi:3-(3-hydroxy-phenyl)propionate hydroxylase
MVGTLVPQPWVIPEPSLRPQRLDEVLGSRLTLLGVDVEPGEWDEVLAVAARRGLPAMRGIDVVLRDRLPTATGQRTAIADADGELERVMAPARGKFVLVKPDRYVAAVFAAGEAEAVASELSRWLRVPGPIAVASGGAAEQATEDAAGLRLESA